MLLLRLIHNINNTPLNAVINRSVADGSFPTILKIVSCIKSQYKGEKDVNQNYTLPIAKTPNRCSRNIECARLKLYFLTNNKKGCEGVIIF